MSIRFLLLGFCMDVYLSVPAKHNDQHKYKNQTLFPALESKGAYNVMWGYKLANLHFHYTAF